MTTQNPIVFQSGFGKSMTIMSSRGSEAATASQALAGVGAYKKSRKGKMPRAVLSAISEANNASLRSEMQEARQALANEFMVEEPLSLAKLRLQRGYSQQQLAKAIGTSQPHIANLEAGKIDPSFDTATRLADALGITMNDIRPLIERARRKQQNVI